MWQHFKAVAKKHNRIHVDLYVWMVPQRMKIKFEKGSFMENVLHTQLKNTKISHFNHSLNGGHQKH